MYALSFDIGESKLRLRKNEDGTGTTYLITPHQRVRATLTWNKAVDHAHTLVRVLKFINR